MNYRGRAQGGGLVLQKPRAGDLQYSPFWVNVSGMELDDTLVALADETRRSILQRLAAGEARVTEIAAPFDISLNSVSKHIRILERAGLVRRRVAGRDHFLSLDPKPMDAVSAWIQRERAAWAARLDRLEAALRAEDAIGAAKTASRKPTAKPRRKP
jgi:DNA-binding transcriptional ArsR family regulator